MSESMRGSRLGATSYESDSGLLAPRALTTYVCTDGHRVTMPFSVEADEIPDTWPCSCGLQGIQMGAVPQPKETKHIRTHWDMLLERRTVKDLEELLKERLAVVRTKAS